MFGVNQPTCVDSLLCKYLLENLGGRSNELIEEFMKPRIISKFMGVRVNICLISN
jgi:hypothetical protein